MSTAADNLFRELKISCSSCSLGELCIAHGLSSREINKLDQAVNHTILLKTGGMLYRQGDTFKSLYAIKSGSVKVITQSQDGQESIMGIYLPGEIIGFDGLANGNYQSSILAIETCHICKIDFDALHLAIPTIHPQLLKHASKAINCIQSSYLTTKTSAEKRVVNFLLNLSERYRQRGYIHTDFYLFLSRSEIGSLLNLTAETISRCLRKLERETYINIVNKRRILINDTNKLRALLQDH